MKNVADQIVSGTKDFASTETIKAVAEAVNKGESITVSTEVKEADTNKAEINRKGKTAYGRNDYKRTDGKTEKTAGLFEKSGICCSSIFQWCRFHIFIKGGKRHAG